MSNFIIKDNDSVLFIAARAPVKTKKMLNDNGFYVNKVAKDLANKNRCIVSTKIKFLN